MAILNLMFHFEAIEASELRNPSTFSPLENNRLLVPEAITSYNKESILNDHLSRISENFKISNELRDRVSFWFDIYTKYSATEEVIHHVEYPWIVYRVVDLKPILEGSGNRWTKYHKAKKFSKNQVQEVRDTLKKLSKRSSFNKLTPKEKEIYDILNAIPGNRKTVIKQALSSVRTQVGQKDYIEAGLASSALYIKEIEKVFTKKNLPLELTRLPFVESSFNVNARSKVGASGIWQVMPYIGKKFLIINDSIDERNSPIKAAHTAAFILKQNMQILKSWPLALTAYNHGTGSLLKGIKATKSRDLNVLIKKYHAKSFGFASQNFYASFLAILHAEKYQEKVFPKVNKESAMSFRELKLTRAIKVKRLVSLTGMSLAEFKNYNLDIRDIAFTKNHTLPRGYVVHIPEGNVETFLTKNKNQKLVVLLNQELSKNL